jgi:hypothetical protein
MFLMSDWIRIRDISAIFSVTSGIDTHMVKLIRVGSVRRDMHDGSYELLICKLFNNSFWFYLVTQRQKEMCMNSMLGFGRYPVLDI